MAGSCGYNVKGLARVADTMMPWHRAGRAFRRRRPLCVDDFDRFPTIADLYEEQAMRRATRAEVSRGQA